MKKQKNMEEEWWYGEGREDAGCIGGGQGVVFVKDHAPAAAGLEGGPIDRTYVGHAEVGHHQPALHCHTPKRPVHPSPVPTLHHLVLFALLSKSTINQS
jgi:hypothetical protein